MISSTRCFFLGISCSFSPILHSYDTTRIGSWGAGHECAVDLQHGMAAANCDLPEDRRIVLRIGINLGDIIVEGGDRYGDGVNIAARLEALADPGGILVSGTAY